jgi:hypothetical protein
MSHYSNFVIIERPEDGITEEAIEAAVNEAMGAHEDQGGFWDWFQIGGRWTGVLDGYDPETDPKNKKPCDLCGGTGDRATYRGEPKELQHPSGCNGCDGTGIRTEWPTQWGFRAGDVQPLANVTPEQYESFYRVITPSDGTFTHKRTEYQPWKTEAEERWRTIEQEMPPLDWLKAEYADHLVVVVDNHS